jgi:hypothetical protein
VHNLLCFRFSMTRINWKAFRHLVTLCRHSVNLATIWWSLLTLLVIDKMYVSLFMLLGLVYNLFRLHLSRPDIFYYACIVKY